MKLTKNTVIRATALILFMSMIAAIILYDGGAYDFTFVKRPIVYTTEGDTTVGGTSPDVTTGFDDTTVTEPPMNDDDILDILSKIMPLDEALKNGYTLSYSKFSATSRLAEVDAPYLEGEFSLRQHSVSKKVFYEIANGSLSTKKETRLEDLPRIRLYYGYAIVDQGELFTVYNKNGEKISDGISVNLPYQKTYDGFPVIKSGELFYKLTDSGLEEIAESDVKPTPIYIDAPRYYAASNIDLHPFKETVMELTQIGVVTTEPPETTPDTTEPPETAPSESTGSDDTTVNGETTVPDGTTAEAETTAPEDTTAEGETAAPDSTASGELPIDSAEAIAEGETTEGETTEGETTEGETTPSETTESETTESETTEGETAPPETSEGETASPDVTEDETTGGEPLPPPAEGDIIEKDGKLYLVSYRELYGYKTSEGKVVIKPQYTMAYDFTSDGLACVIYENYRLLFIDTKGNRVVSLLGNPYVSPSDMNYKKHYQAYYSGINNNYLDMGMYYYSEGHAIVRYALLDAKTATKLVKTVNLIVDKSGNRIPVPGDYVIDGYSDGVMLVHKNGRYGYLNLDHSWVYHPVFDDARPFFQGLAVAHTDGGYGMVDTEGNTVLPFIYDYVSDVSDGRVAAYSSENGWQIFTVINK